MIKNRINTHVVFIRRMRVLAHLADPEGRHCAGDSAVCELEFHG